MGDSPLFSGEGGMAEVLARRTMISGALLLVACRGRAAAADDGSYRWTELTGAAPYPGAYNFPVHVAADGRFVALHAQGTWSSRDGRNWVKEPLPASGTNSAYLPLIAHEGASWAIGTIDGDYRHFTIDPVVRRTADYRGWTTGGARAVEPARRRRDLDGGRADVRDRGEILAAGKRRARVHLFERCLGDAARAMNRKKTETLARHSCEPWDRFAPRLRPFSRPAGSDARTAFAKAGANAP